MTKGLQRSLSRAPKGRATAAPALPVVQRFEVSALTLTVDGATGVGFGSAVAGDFPEGNINFLGAVAQLQFTGPTDAGLVDTWEGDYGVGTTPAADATISGSDVDIVGSTALAAATAEVSPSTRGIGATPAVFDNTDGSLELNISLLVDDADISADGIDMTVSGWIEVTFAVLGDD